MARRRAAARWTRRWQLLKGKVKQLWPQFTDEDLKEAEHDYDRIVTVIHEHTSELIEVIQERLNG